MATAHPKPSIGPVHATYHPTHRHLLDHQSSLYYWFMVRHPIWLDPISVFLQIIWTLHVKGDYISLLASLDTHFALDQSHLLRHGYTPLILMLGCITLPTTPNIYDGF